MFKKESRKIIFMLKLIININLKKGKNQNMKKTNEIFFLMLHKKKTRLYKSQCQEDLYSCAKFFPI